MAASLAFRRISAGARAGSLACGAASARCGARRWRTVPVVLLEHIDELGFQGQEVEVRAGFARNHLIPKKLATYADEDTRASFKADMTAEEEAEANKEREKSLLRKRLEALSLRFAVATVDDEELYGSVTPADVATLVNSKLRLPVPLDATTTRIVAREDANEVSGDAKEEIRAMAARRYEPVIKRVGWHLIEATTVSGSGEGITALLEVQVISSSA